MDLSQYMGMFLEESREHLQNISQGLLSLESNPEDTRQVNEIFRSAHTLKGMSATMGFNQIAELTHQMENVLSKFRNGEIRVYSGIIDTMFRCLDSLESMVEKVANGETVEKDNQELIEELQGHLVTAEEANSQAPEDQAPSGTGEPPGVEHQGTDLITSNVELNEYEKNVILQSWDQGFRPFHMVISINPACIMKAARAFMVFKRLEELGEIIKTVPSVSDIEDEKFDTDFEVILLTTADESTIGASVGAVTEILPPRLTMLQVVSDNVSREQAETASAPAPEPANEGEPKAGPEPVQPQTLNHTQDQVPSKVAAKPAAPSQPNLGGKVRATSTIRVDITRLDALMNLVGELVINKTRLAQIGKTTDNHDLSETVEQMDRVFVDLQNLVMKVRMVPIDQVFSRFPRMVRDLARDLGKNIELEISGQETELDRTVIDEIGDPLVHLLRNSVDHGVETPEERTRMGKAEVATVKLSARHEGNSVIIEVADDGKGIDPQRIKSKAIEKGMLTPQEAEQMDDDTAANLIFAAGFSTAEKISDVSGRGVGLDAVRSKIEALSGECKLHTAVGEGTVFTIQLPLTLAIIQALLVRAGEETFAIPLSFIEETTSIFAREIKEVQDQDTMLLRGHVLPLVRLDTAVGLPPRKWNPEEELMVVVVRKGGRNLGLLVDDLEGQQEVVIKPLGELVGGLQGIGGATILGDGTVALILDISTLV
ncbi:MAG TPA: chemotaxis protein CheA [Bacillota bacterium]|nr:chemotaxis protein CheA [Bacillota bacterium]